MLYKWENEVVKANVKYLHVCMQIYSIRKCRMNLQSDGHLNWTYYRLVKCSSPQLGLKICFTG